jgi:hypothetical protein
MYTKLTLFSFLLLLFIFSCKKENTFTDYKFSDKPETITCEGLNNALFKEALYSLEDDLLNFYQKTNPKTSLTQAYSQFLRLSIYGRLKHEDIISEHTLSVFKALKNESDLWDTNNTKSYLNYNSAIIQCISNNIKDEALKTTFNALLSTNSMSPKLFGSPLINKYRNALNDKYLATYMALDLFYAKLFDIDFTKINLDKPEQKVDFNKVPQTPESDPHAGHNH